MKNRQIGNGVGPKDASVEAIVVSVVMSNRNGQAHLAEAISSVLAQSLGAIELILGDDASTDRSLAIAAGFARDDPRVVILTGSSPRGPGAARNRALEICRGAFVAIVDSDDVIHCRRLERLVARAGAMQLDGIADDLVFFGAETGRTLLGPLGLEGPSLIDAARLLDLDTRKRQAVPLGYLKPLFRRSALGSLRYREDLPVGEDFDLLLRFLLRAGAFALVPESDYFYRRHAASTSHRLTGEAVTKMIAAQDEVTVADPEIRRLLALRRGGLEAAGAFEATAALLRQRRIAPALGALTRRPSLRPNLARAALAGTRRRLGVPRYHPLTAATPLPAGSNTPLSPLVHIRTPTFRRPAELRRCLQSLQAQTHPVWICDVFDDDPDGSAEAVVAALRDPRVRYRRNSPQKRASLNIDQCFSRANPHGAGHFCVVEDDNHLLPRFFEDNIRLCSDKGVEIVLRDQFVEHGFGTPEAHLSERGVLAGQFSERVYQPAHFRLALMAGIGVSNGGLFWTARAVSDLEIAQPVSATLQEYIRTFAVAEPIYVALEPLAVWAENGTATTRDLGARAGWFRRELALKSSVARLQRLVWKAAPEPLRHGFLADEAFAYPADSRARGLVKANLSYSVGGALSRAEVLRLALRGAVIRLVGRPEPGLAAYLGRLSRAV